jgi:cytochrome P450
MIDILNISLVVLFLWWYKKKVWIYPNNFPPGPRCPIPVLGDAWRFGKELPPALEKLHQKHGPIVGFSFADRPTVSISDYNMIEELLNTNTFSGRPYLGGYIDARGEVDNFNPGIIFGDGPKWSNLRRFTLR